MSKPIPAAFRMLADSYINDAAEHGTRFGDVKVFLCTIPGIDLKDAECVNQLAYLLRSGLVQFARADLVGAMDPDLVARSHWRLDISDFHFLVLPERFASY